MPLLQKSPSFLLKTPQDSNINSRDTSNPFATIPIPAEENIHEIESTDVRYSTSTIPSNLSYDLKVEQEPQSLSLTKIDETEKKISPEPHKLKSCDISSVCFAETSEVTQPSVTTEEGTFSTGLYSTDEVTQPCVTTGEENLSTSSTYTDEETSRTSPESTDDGTQPSVTPERETLSTLPTSTDEGIQQSMNTEEKNTSTNPKSTDEVTQPSVTTEEGSSSTICTSTDEGTSSANLESTHEATQPFVIPEEENSSTSFTSTNERTSSASSESTDEVTQPSVTTEEGSTSTIFTYIDEGTSSTSPESADEGTHLFATSEGGTLIISPNTSNIDHSSEVQRQDSSCYNEYLRKDILEDVKTTKSPSFKSELLQYTAIKEDSSFVTFEDKSISKIEVAEHIGATQHDRDISDLSHLQIQVENNYTKNNKYDTGEEIETDIIDKKYRLDGFTITDAAAQKSSENCLEYEKSINVINSNATEYSARGVAIVDVITASPKSINKMGKAIHCNNSPDLRRSANEYFHEEYQEIITESPTSTELIEEREEIILTKEKESQTSMEVNESKNMLLEVTPDSRSLIIHVDELEDEIKENNFVEHFHSEVAETAESYESCKTNLIDKTKQIGNIDSSESSNSSSEIPIKNSETLNSSVPEESNSPHLPVDCHSTYSSTSENVMKNTSEDGESLQTGIHNNFETSENLIQKEHENHLNCNTKGQAANEHNEQDRSQPPQDYFNDVNRKSSKVFISLDKNESDNISHSNSRENQSLEKGDDPTCNIYSLKDQKKENTNVASVADQLYESENNNFTASQEPSTNVTKSTANENESNLSKTEINKENPRKSKFNYRVVFCLPIR